MYLKNVAGGELDAELGCAGDAVQSEACTRQADDCTPSTPQTTLLQSKENAGDGNSDWGEVSIL